AILLLAAGLWGLFAPPSKSALREIHCLRGTPRRWGLFGENNQVCVIVLLMWSAVRLPRMEAFLIFLATVIVVSLMLANDPTLLAT
ncbi:intracellular growth attenuator family protein, partial [Salmonella enterica subsp. enterica serovar Cerro]|nr:intracellular growth attenuator family protein [Salmonella enterica subsp. enterica serovar Cerro]